MVIKMDWKDVCPECDSEEINNQKPEEVTNNQGFEWAKLCGYNCKECGCEWTVTEKTTLSLNIDKHGDTSNIPC